MAPLRPCVTHRCPNYAVSGKSRCVECGARDWAEGRTGKRGSRPGWRAKRARAARRQGDLCAHCHRPLGDAWECHHADGDAKNDSDSNLIAVHAECHKAVRTPGQNPHPGLLAR